MTNARPGSMHHHLPEVQDESDVMQMKTSLYASARRRRRRLSAPTTRSCCHSQPATSFPGSYSVDRVRWISRKPSRAVEEGEARGSPPLARAKASAAPWKSRFAQRARRDRRAWQVILGAAATGSPRALDPQVRASRPLTRMVSGSRQFNVPPRRDVASAAMIDVP